MSQIGITGLRPEDRPQWNQLGQGYLDFYENRAAVGCGRALIERVAAAARERGCARLYWTTKEDNRAARRLCDHIARFNRFIRYGYPLG